MVLVVEAEELSVSVLFSVKLKLYFTSSGLSARARECDGSNLPLSEVPRWSPGLRTRNPLSDGAYSGREYNWSPNLIKVLAGLTLRNLLQNSR